MHIILFMVYFQWASETFPVGPQLQQTAPYGTAAAAAAAPQPPPAPAAPTEDWSADTENWAPPPATAAAAPPPSNEWGGSTTENWG